LFAFNHEKAWIERDASGKVVIVFHRGMFCLTRKPDGVRIHLTVVCCGDKDQNPWFCVKELLVPSFMITKLLKIWCFFY